MKRVCCAALLALAAWGADVALAQAAVADAASAPTHRSLRLPLPAMDALPTPTEPEVFNGYPGSQPYTVVPRKPELPLYPCTMCHATRKTNPTPRAFKAAPPPEGAPHAGNLNHGKGRFWCLECHTADDRETLHAVNGKKIDFDDSPKLCGQCHSARYRDWVFGGHGKRVAGWTGERQLYACTACHDPHAPQLPARAPSKPPPVRAGLSAMAASHDITPIKPWQRAPQGSSHVQPARP